MRDLTNTRTMYSVPQWVACSERSREPLTFQAAERNIEICKGLIDMVNAERMTRVDPITLQPLPVRDIKIAFDEVGTEVV